mmetsp:Transcript_14223/g.16546  ORF Transcript_14223/g.16546 Transcript_14223/m.16546 type:complete len:958 (+) Transcript_14223:90-2963(+)
MDDNDVCPLCCEELDMSDRQFFPCKCGYQVCMWCWHRIKESESGLCPACRTPYGDDPHEFSAVDMEEVVKANKEKATAEKREKERLKHQQAAAAAGNLGIGGGAGVAGMHIGGGSDGDLAVATSVGSRGHLDPPSDRNQLANMRVIRRNLVYAVGLPPHIATEEILRKPEYFGQFGKVSKIVLNRNHNGNGDPRRASASAYVTFAHKEDALACILAVDGFYLDARNTRASYGTSKYCSAFIKNVRCNNPDCTYLHMMGDSEDTFSKQEIQAGYVTSGRDVLAKQQQLAASISGSSSRRRVGNGGPSGTGKVASNPIFPPPTYDEPSKLSQSNLVPPAPPSTSSTAQFPPVSSSLQRFSSTTGISGFCTVAAGGSSKITRATSVPNSIASNTATPSTSAAPTLTPAEMLSRQQEQLRKMHPQNNTKTTSTTTTSSQRPQRSQPVSNGVDRSVSGASSVNSSSSQATAASVVAGVHSTSRNMSTGPAPHTTLTALTPLKRVNSNPEKNKQTLSTQDTISDSNSNNNSKLSALRNNSTSLGNGNNQSNGRIGSVAVSSSTISSKNGTAISSSKVSPENVAEGAGAIGGTIIGNSMTASNSGVIWSTGSRGPTHPIGMIGGSNDGINSSVIGKTAPVASIGAGNLSENNNIVGGQTIGNFVSNSDSNTVGNDLFSSSMMSGGGDMNQWGFSSAPKNTGSDSLFGGPDSNLGAIGGTGIWGNESEEIHAPSQFGVGGSVGSLSESTQPSAPGNLLSVSGSSALASMLGIQLPTGIGTLRETLWASSTPVREPSSGMKNSNAPTPIGPGMKKSNKGVIIGGGRNINDTGGVPIGGVYGPPAGNAPVNGDNSSDIKLLQTLLPGVHITSGNAYQPAAPNMGMNGNQQIFGEISSRSQPNNHNNHIQHQQPDISAPIGAIGVGGLLQRDTQSQQVHDMWGKMYASTAAPAPISNKPQQKGNADIW